MKPGSVTVDLAAEMGGNVETTRPGKCNEARVLGSPSCPRSLCLCPSWTAGEVALTPNGVTCIGYTDLPSRLPTQSSTMFSNNLTKFLLSMGPFSTGSKGAFLLDHKDEAVRGALVLDKGVLTWPAPPPKQAATAAAAVRALPRPVCDNLQTGRAAKAASIRTCARPPPIASASQARPAAAAAAAVEDPYQSTMQSALMTSGAVASVLGLGAISPNPAFSAMLTKFGLASICGYQTVWGVTPALHSPLMSVTNAISGLTAVGGMMLMGGGLVPETPAQALAFVAVLASAINIGGGFTITQRMLDMFRRPTDPPEFNRLYALPGAVLVGGLAGAQALGLGSTAGLTEAAYLASSASCIAAISCLSNQKTARVGNALGAIGVAGGIATALGHLPVASPAVYGQILAATGLGGALGVSLAKGMKITDLPQVRAAQAPLFACRASHLKSEAPLLIHRSLMQMVAAFHSLVGLAAVTTGIANYMHQDPMVSLLFPREHSARFRFRGAC